MGSQNGKIVEVHNLSKTYVGETPVQALDKVSFGLPRGKFLAVTGPSGSGKSTLLNIVGTLDSATKGKVLVNGVDTGDLEGNALADFRRSQIGFIFQLFNLVPVLSAQDNVMLPMLPYRRELEQQLETRALALLEEVGLGKRKAHLPSQLSGGEQQRVAIARALINAPKLIVADEPTGNLDSKTGRGILELLKKLQREQGLSILLVTHDEGLASQADEVLRLQDGRVEKN